jgi:hypothetical protein
VGSRNVLQRAGPVRNVVCLPRFSRIGHISRMHALRSVQNIGAFALLAIGCARPNPTIQSLPAAPDTLRLDEVRAVIMAAGPAVLMSRVSTPEPYLTDLVGVQPLRLLTRAQVLADLVPRLAQVVEDTPRRVRLQFHSGPLVDFTFGTAFYLDTNPLRVPYARVHIKTPASYPAETDAFRTIMREANLAAKYLPANPYYRDEQTAAARLRDTVTIAVIQPERDTAAFKAAGHAVLLVGETHGTSQAFDRVRHWLSSPQVDWLGIEMLSEDMQSVVNAFLKAPESSAEYRTAREQLLRFYSESWNTRDIERTSTPEQNPYFRLLEQARQNGKAVYALDAPLVFTAFRWGEFPLGAATRDLIWSGNIPAQGRGIVYGGSSHFMVARKPNFLTFLKERDPAVRFFTAS